MRSRFLDLVLLILFANLKTRYDNAKVNNMANIAIIFNSSAEPVFITNITVVIAPGPANKGMAIGKIETSSLLVASRILLRSRVLYHAVTTYNIDRFIAIFFS